jgi:hypothetical protein
MAMNKKEQQRLEEAESKLAAAMALGWPREPKPEPVDVCAQLEGKKYGALFVGWWSHTWGVDFRIGQGCSSGHFHSTSSTEKTTTQGGGRFYFTREEALLAARWELCERFADVLARLDAKNDEPRHGG